MIQHNLNNSSVIFCIFTAVVFPFSLELCLILFLFIFFLSCVLITVFFPPELIGGNFRRHNQSPT